jgi:hypothetical protein
MTMRLKRFIAACAITIVAGPAHQVLEAESSVAAVRELYVSAAYEDALKLLEELQGGTHTREERRSIGLYRVLCLVAVGRTGEADQAIETLVAQEPLYRPPMDDLSPRMRTAFTDARKRLLPLIIQQQYREAKAAFDRQDHQAAAAGFALVLEGLAEPEVAQAAAQPPLSDLRTLATGFQDLSVKALAPPPPPALEPAPVVIVAPPAAPVRDYKRTYTVDDEGVELPAPIRQAFPRFAGKVPAAASGVIDILIDAMGTVETVTLRETIDPRYDNQLVTAAKRWQYKPATVDGVPVKFLKSVKVNLAPDR